MSSPHTYTLKSAEFTYARALLQIAEPAGRLDEMAQQVAELRELLTQQPQLMDLMASRIIPAAKRAQSLERIFKGHIDDTLLNFILVVNRKDRLDLLPNILQAFQVLVDEKRGLIDVHAYVADELDQALADQVAQAVGQAFGKVVQLRQQVDPSLIGGLKIRVGDQLVDGSVVTQLRLVRQRIVERGREQARELQTNEA